MRMNSGDFIGSDNREHEPEQVAVLAVPHIPDFGLTGDVTKLEPTHETLSVVRISNGIEQNAALAYMNVEWELAHISPVSPPAIKEEWLRRKYPNHKPVEVPIDGYVPANNRGPRSQLTDNIEWVTVVKKGDMYLGLNDAEFEEWKSNDMVVVGQAIRNMDPNSEELRASYSLLGLFGVDESGHLHP